MNSIAGSKTGSLENTGEPVLFHFGTISPSSDFFRFH